MHLPDGFLSLLVAILFWILSAIVIGIALHKSKLTLGERQVPLMGVLAAAIFAGQMLNFTVAGGTSGHLLGAAIAAILLGPWPAVLVMTSVVSIQALAFPGWRPAGSGCQSFQHGHCGGVRLLHSLQRAGKTPSNA